MKTLLALLLASFVFLSGCCSTKQYADPADISLKNALLSVSDSLDAMRQASATNDPFGLFPKEVDVTFNISASRENNGELKLDLGAPAGSPVTATAGGSLGFKATGLRGNQITIKFANIMSESPEATILGKQGTNVIKLIRALHDARSRRLNSYLIRRFAVTGASATSFNRSSAKFLARSVSCFCAVAAGNAKGSFA